MKKLIFPIILTFFSLPLILNSQKANYNWYFHYKCAITYNNPNLEPKPLFDCRLSGFDIQISRSATISDENGNLLFYSGGIKSDPDDPKSDIFDKYSNGLIAHKESVHSYFSAIIPYPGKKNLYVWINKSPKTEELRVDIIDKTKRNGLGDIVQTNTIFHEQLGHLFAVIKHSNNIDWWLCFLQGQPPNSGYIVHSILFTSNGINLNIIKSSMDIQPSFDRALINFPLLFNTPLKGNSIIFAIPTERFHSLHELTPVDIDRPKESFLTFVNFNRTTGKFSTIGSVKIRDSCWIYQPIFSPSGSKIYIPLCYWKKIPSYPDRTIYHYTFKLYQSNFNVNNTKDIPNTMVQIGPTKNAYIIITEDNINGGLKIEGDSILWNYSSKLGPNGKIYFIHPWAANYISEISNPDAEAKDIIYKDTAVFFKDRKIWNLPWTPYDDYNLWLELNSNSPICYGDSLHLSLTLSDTTKKPQKIIWSGPDGFTSSKQNPSLVARKSGFYKVTVTVSGAEISDSIWVEVSNPTPKIVAPKRFCQGDTIEILVDKEFPSYFWSTGDTTKKIKIHNPGTYFVTVIDSNNCIGRDTVFIVSDFVTAKIFGAKTICKGKEIVLEAFPKGSQFRYLWSTGETTDRISISRGGKYWLLVTNENGCKGTDTIEVKELPYLEFSIDGDTLLCSGSTIELVASLRGSGYSYLWSTGDTKDKITITRGGTYWLRVSDENGCEGYDTIVVKEYPKPQAKIKIEDDRPTICSGKSKKLFAEPSGNYSYLWWNGSDLPYVEINKGGNYWLVVSNEFGCKDTSYVTITEVVPEVPKIIGDSLICNGESGILSLDGKFISYRWSTGDTTRTIVVNKPGSYRVNAVDINGCQVTAEIFVNTYAIDLSGLEPLDFGDVQIGSSASKNIILRNNSNTKVRIKEIKLKHNTEEFSIDATTPIELLENEQTEILVVYNSKGKLTQSDTILVVVDYPCVRTFSIPLIVKVTGVHTLVWLPDTTALVGTKGFCIPLRAMTDGVPLENLSFEAIIRFDATAFQPDNRNFPIENGERVVSLSGSGLTIGNDGTLLGEFCGEVLLARNKVTPLRIEKFQWSSPNIQIETKDGTLTTTGVCMPEFSQIELFQPTEISIVPNPAEDEIEITIIGERNSSFILEISNSMGSIIEKTTVSLEDKIKIIKKKLTNYLAGIYFLRIGNKYASFIKL